MLGPTFCPVVSINGLCTWCTICRLLYLRSADDHCSWPSSLPCNCLSLHCPYDLKFVLTQRSYYAKRVYAGEVLSSFAVHHNSNPGFYLSTSEPKSYLPGHHCRLSWLTWRSLLKVVLQVALVVVVLGKYLCYSLRYIQNYLRIVCSPRSLWVVCLSCPWMIFNLRMLVFTVKG